MRRHNLHLYALAALAAVLGYFAIAEVGTPTSSGSVSFRAQTETVTAEDGVVQSTVSGSGNVEAGVDDDVDFAISGTLAAVYVHDGEHVKKGQILARLDPSSAQLTLDGAQATLTAAKDTLATAEDDSSTTTSTTSTSTTSTAADETTLASDKLAVENDERTVATDSQALAETTLRAPAGGTIASLEDLQPGDSVSSGTTSTGSSGSSSDSGSSSTSDTTTDSSAGSGSSSTAFAEIINTSTLTMTVAFSESDIGEIKVGQAATVAMEALSGVELGAHVSSISSDATDSDSVVSYDVTLKVDQSDPRIRSGMSATAAVIVHQADGVTVPTAAVTGSGSADTVTVQKNGRDVRQPVVVGLRGTSRTEIASGLKAGESVLVSEAVPSLGSSSGVSGTTTTSSSSGTLGGGAAALGGGAGFAGGAAAGGGPPGGAAP